MIRTITVAVAVMALVVATPDGGHHGEHYGNGGYGGGRNYNFDYAVKADYGANFGHSEGGDGYSAKGKYFVYLPDGRLQIVNYYTDKWGYHADVVYKGQAHHPSSYGPATTFYKGKDHSGEHY